MELIKIDRLKELEKRNVAVEGLQPLLKGAEGEKWVFDTLREFGQPHWQILRNVWLDDQGLFECDLAVFTNAGMYAFEIKNYSGHLSIQNGACLLNRTKIGYHPIYQT